MEHLELADCTDEPSAGHHRHGAQDEPSPFHTADHRHPPLAEIHKENQTGTDKKPGTGSHTDLDCKIYHAFQNLNGIGGASQQLVPGIARQNTGTTDTLLHFVSDSLEIPQIRAPPALS